MSACQKLPQPLLLKNIFLGRPSQHLVSVDFVPRNIKDDSNSPLLATILLHLLNTLALLSRTPRLQPVLHLRLLHPGHSHLGLLGVLGHPLLVERRPIFHVGISKIQIPIPIQFLI